MMGLDMGLMGQSRPEGSPDRGLIKWKGEHGSKRPHDLVLLVEVDDSGFVTCRPGLLDEGVYRNDQ